MAKKKVDTIVIMCVWQRIGRLKKTLDMLLKQKDRYFHLYLWNNNPDVKEQVDEIVAEYNDSIVIHIKHSDENVKGMGRFIAAKEVSDEYEKVIFIDDDQEFNENLISIFKNHYNDNTLKSRWAFIMRNTYMNRMRATDSNIDVNYCGTGGMILPSSVFKNEGLFEIPDEFAWIEDLWITYYCNAILGMKTQSIHNRGNYIKQVVDGKDQSTPGKLKEKNKFLEYLRKELKWEK